MTPHKFYNATLVTLWIYVTFQQDILVGAQVNGTASNKLFYMYDLEESFWWRWPTKHSDCSGNGYVGHEHAELSGIGRPINLTQGLFLTWHFSLFSSLFNRYKRSPHRTMDPDKASMFLIPYDLGLDGFLARDTCSNRRKCTSSLVDKLTVLLSNSTYFKRHKGADHVVLWSLGNYHPWPRHCSDFMKVTCARCTFTCYWMDGFKPDNNFISVPFPAAYHWHDAITDIPWAVDNPAAPQRNFTVLYLGSAKTLNPDNTKVRRAMVTQCQAHPHCVWKQILHSSKDNSIADHLTIYRKTVFCLCPPGDDPGRKAVFDAIVSGCIPVLFHYETLFNQYPWHLGEDLALDISVYIPGGPLRQGTIQFMDVLMSIPASVIRQKQELIAQVAPRLQYAVPPMEQLRSKRNSTLWSPPFADGAELALLGMFERTARVVNNEKTGIPNMRGKTRLELLGEYSKDSFVKIPGQPREPYTSYAASSAASSA